MQLDQRLIDAAVALLKARFPSGEGVAAALYTEDGALLTSVGFDPAGGVASLCAETGAILEAHKLGKRVVACACVVRKAPEETPRILSPCGVCQERLVNWGYDVEVAVPDASDPTMWQARRLHEVTPYHWRKPVAKGRG